MFLRYEKLVMVTEKYFKQNYQMQISYFQQTWSKWAKRCHIYLLSEYRYKFCLPKFYIYRPVFDFTINNRHFGAGVVKIWCKNHKIDYCSLVSSSSVPKTLIRMRRVTLFLILELYVNLKWVSLKIEQK